ncbi:MAG: GNAT family N-acetyltransferase [Alphaproteobacteria bacterium]|nr:GNAT family N-acetyltransferase [Alphaproteobacteria bacterium]
MSGDTMTGGFEFDGYFPGAIGGIAELHGALYAESHGMGVVFEARVARDMGDLLLRFDPRYDFFRTVRRGRKFMGSIAIDGSRTRNEGHLRCFILAPEARGRGFGRQLLDEALAFCRERGFERIYLWTLAGLEPAGRLYREAGFKVTKEEMGDQWGRRVLEQEMELLLRRA